MPRYSTASMASPHWSHGCACTWKFVSFASPSRYMANLNDESRIGDYYGYLFFVLKPHYCCVRGLSGPRRNAVAKEKGAKLVTEKEGKELTCFFPSLASFQIECGLCRCIGAAKTRTTHTGTGSHAFCFVAWIVGDWLWWARGRRCTINYLRRNREGCLIREPRCFGQRMV